MLSIYSAPGILIYFCVLAFVLGAVLGSFINCAAWRICAGESFLKGRSHCTSCGHALGILDLVPIFSWIFLKGKCRYCGEKISIRYPLTEIGFGLLFVGTLLRFDLTVECLRNMVLLGCLFCLTLTDLQSYMIPDGCHIISILAWAAAAPFMSYTWGNVLYYVLSGLGFGGALLGISLIMDKILKKDSLGGGDIKLAAVMGLYLGSVSALFALIAACIIGLIIAFAGKKKNENGAFPFGPAMAVSIAIMLFAGQPLTSWYMNLLF